MSFPSCFLVHLLFFGRRLIFYYENVSPRPGERPTQVLPGGGALPGSRLTHRPSMRPRSRARDSGGDSAGPSTRLGISLSAWWKMFAFREVTLLSRADLWRKQDTKAVFGSEAQTGPCPRLLPWLHLAQGPRGARVCPESSLSPVGATPSCAHAAGLCPVRLPGPGVSAHFGGWAVGEGTGGCPHGGPCSRALSGWLLLGRGLDAPGKVGGSLSLLGGSPSLQPHDVR